MFLGFCLLAMGLLIDRKFQEDILGEALLYAGLVFTAYGGVQAIQWRLSNKYIEKPAWTSPTESTTMRNLIFIGGTCGVILLIWRVQQSQQNQVYI